MKFSQVLQSTLVSFTIVTPIDDGPAEESVINQFDPSLHTNDAAGDLGSLRGNGPSRSWVSASSTIPSASFIVSRTSSSRCGVGVKTSFDLDESRVLGSALDLEFSLESEISASLSRAWRAGLY